MIRHRDMHQQGHENKGQRMCISPPVPHVSKSLELLNGVKYNSVHKDERLHECIRVKSKEEMMSYATIINGNSYSICCCFLL